MEAITEALDRFLSHRSLMEKINISNLVVVSPNIIAFVAFALLYRKNNATFDKILRLLVNLSTGTLFADLVKNIIPETIGELQKLQAVDINSTKAFGLVLLLTLIFLITVDKFSRYLNNKGKKAQDSSNFIKVVTFLFSDGIHNFMDGIAIASFYKMGHRYGITSTIAIFIHEIPHQLGDFSLLVLKGYSVFSVLMLQSLTSVATLMGGVFAEKFDDRHLPYLNAVVIVSFVHLIFTHIVPSIVKETDTLLMILLEMLSLYVGYLQIKD